jgi:hypothetical protein
LVPFASIASVRTPVVPASIERTIGKSSGVAGSAEIGADVVVSGLMLRLLLILVEVQGVDVGDVRGW